MLEQIAIERNGPPAAERYAEFRRRFQRAAGIAPPKAMPHPPRLPRPLRRNLPCRPLRRNSTNPSRKLLPNRARSRRAHGHSHAGRIGRARSRFVGRMGGALAAVGGSDRAGCPAGPPARPSDDSRSRGASQEEDGREAEEAPAFDLELQPVSPAGVAENEALSDGGYDFLRTSRRIWNRPRRPWAFQCRMRRITPRPSAPLWTARLPCFHSAQRRSRCALFRGRATETDLLATCLKNFAPNWANSTRKTKISRRTTIWGSPTAKWACWKKPSANSRKVRQSADKGPAFRYAMQCSTLLGLAFMEKGQPAIAAIWYERALKTPGLDQESILALRYDLGVAQELAGETGAAFKSFSQVYAMNIDYRDVSERIALLGKTR